jgi:hypothetical protein
VNSIGFNSLSITVVGRDRRMAVSQTALRTRFGLIAPDAGFDLEKETWVQCEDIVGRIGMINAGAWVQRPQQEDVKALVLKPEALPRAVLWSTIVRTCVDALRLDDTENVDVLVDGELDDAGVDDAMRACALAELTIATINGGSIASNHPVFRWQQRKPWTTLQLAESGETLIAEEMRLPATVRFGKRYVSYGIDAATQTLRIKISDATLTVQTMDSAEFLGQQEFEVVWDVDGRISLNLLIDGAWRPIPEIVISDALDDTNGAALQEYRRLASWNQVCALMQVHLLENLDV